MGDVVAFTRPYRSPAGEVFVEPIPEDGGCWGIFHESRDRKSVACVGTRFSFSDAFEDAERFAREIRADFHDGSGGHAA